ncbi:MAG: PIG-L deacetylase family protein [Caulobacter sp.]|nr:PIG-L deacetylase family protein [Caulobacter sp.]
MKRVLVVVLGIAAVLVGLSVVLFMVANARVNDGAVPVAGSLLVPGAPKTVLAVWAHPDDEITSAGTLARLAKEEGARVVLVYMSRGEAAKGLGYTADQLAALRPPEARAAGKALGAARVVVLDYPDGGLTDVDDAAAKAAIRRIIDEEKPSIVISFDEKVGFYGHPDHARTGRWVRAVVDDGASEPDFPVKRLYQATLPTSLVKLALKLVDAFRTRYPKDPAQGLPAPDLAIRIPSQAASKRAVLDAHTTQVKIIADVQPGYDKVPAWLYYRLFDREYYAVAVIR